MDLKSIILSITPENLKNIPIIDTSLKIFIDYIKKNNEISQRITALFEVSEYEDDSESLKKSKNILKEGLYYTWIYTLYNALNKLAADTQIIKDLEKYNYTEAGLYQGINHIVSPEFVSANRIFSQKVGTKEAIRYMYYFGKYLETGNYSDDLDIDELHPFVMNYEGSMSKRMFRGTVKPLAHPIGWIDTYVQVISLIFHDFYGIEIFKSYAKIELQNNDKWIVFIHNNDKDAVFKDFRKRINPSTNKPYTDSEIEACVTIFNDKVVRSFDQRLNEDGSIDKVIIFEDNTVLYHFSYPYRKTIFSTYEDYLNNFQNPIYVWGSEWIFYGDLSANFKFLYFDTINEFEKELAITNIKENNGGKCDLSTYTDLYMPHQFKVGGEDYPYVYGSDESRFKVNNYNEVNDEVKSKFNVDLNYNVKRACSIIIEDDYDNKRIFKFDDAGEGTFSLNTFDLKGFNYKITIDEISGSKYWFRTRGLNEFNKMIDIKSVFTENDVLRVTGTADFKPSENQFCEFVVSDFEGKQTVYKLETPGEFELKLPILQPFVTGFGGLHDVELETNDKIISINDTLLDEAVTVSNKVVNNLTLDSLELTDNVIDLGKGNFRIDAYIKNSKKRIFYKTFFEGIDLRLYSDIEPRCSLITYKERPSFVFDTEPLDSILNLRGMYSKADYINVRIGELNDGKFSNPDSLLAAYLPNPIPENYDIFNDDSLNNVIIRGSLVEGNNYNNSTWEYFPTENTFIGIGFKQYEIETSDFIITDSNRFVRDDFDISIINKAFYLYTKIDLNVDNNGHYLYSSDGQYLYTKENNIEITFETFGGTNLRRRTFEKNTRWKYIKETLRDPIKTGFKFLYWSLRDDGVEIDDMYRFSSDTKLFAVYTTEDKIITISFDLGD